MVNTKLSLALIVRNNPDSLRKLLESVKPVQFDEIVVVDTGSSDSKTKEVALEFGAKVFDWLDPRPEFLKEHGHISDFSAARKFSFEQCSNDMVMWCDADDVLINGAGLREQFELEYAKHGEDLGIVLSYFYSKDARGNWNTTQKKIRLVNRKSFVWMGRVHEDLIAQKQVQWIPVLPAITRLEHDIYAKDGAGTTRDKRNVTILQDQLKDEGGLDPRLMKHLGQGYEGLKDWSKAIICYEAAYKASNWPEDIYQIKMNIAGCYRSLGLPHKALQYDLESTEICPEFPNAWVNLAMDEVMLKHWHKCLFYTQTALECKKISDTLGLNPSGLRLALYLVRHEAFRELGKIPEALQCLKEVELEYPDVEQWKRNIGYLEKCIKDADVYRAFVKIAESLAQERNMEKLEMFYRSHPQQIADYPDFQWLKRKKPDVLKASIALICPGEGWGPSSIENGIGGSEEAVMLLSKELVKAGFWVDVFTNSPEEGEHEGVNWYPFHAIRPQLDFYDTVVIWRQTELLDHPWNCQKLVFWSHDVQFGDRWTERRIQKVDQVFFLSKYHRSTASFIPEEKCVISANGLDPQYFAQSVERDPKKVIYVSNPTRGLKEALLMWPKIHKETGATLHTYYGWTNLTKLAFVDQPLEAKKMYEVQELMRVTPGVIDHGMIGMTELSKETASAGIALYPTTFPEVSCISMMRNQALGAIPVTTNVAALDETVQHGIKIKPEGDWQKALQDQLIDLIQNPFKQEEIRKPMMAWAQKNFLWSDVAKQWYEILEGKTWTASEVTPKVELALAGL